MKAIEPKRAFLASPRASRFADALALPEVREAIEVALQQFVVEQQATGDLSAAAVAHIALEGAKRYAHILLNLAEPSEGLPPDQSSLSYQRAGRKAPSERAVARSA